MTQREDNITQAGQSAQREYQRRQTARRRRVRAKYGPVGSATAAVAGEPRTVTAWQQGADGEAATARALERHLRRTNVIVLHDRRIPGRGRANIDHLAIGPGGITVIDTKSSRATVQLTTRGIVNRRELLLVNGHDRTRQLDSLQRQINVVTHRLHHAAGTDIDVIGALCFPHMRRAFLHNGRTRGGLITVDDPRHIAKLTNRPGQFTADDITHLAQTLAELFPSANS